MSGANASPAGRSHQVMTAHDFSFWTVAYIRSVFRPRSNWSDALRARVSIPHISTDGDLVILNTCFANRQCRIRRWFAW